MKRASTKEPSASRTAAKRGSSFTVPGVKVARFLEIKNKSRTERQQFVY